MKKKQLEQNDKDVETSLMNYSTDLIQMHKDYGKFFMGLESCFAVQDVKNEAFLDLRDQVVCDLMAYYEKVVPATLGVLQLSLECFDYFLGMDMDDYLECFEELNEDFHKTRDGFNLISKIHGPVLSNAKARSLEAARVNDAITKVGRDLEEKIKTSNLDLKELNKKIAREKENGFWDFVPVVNIFANMKRKKNLDAYGEKLSSSQRFLFLQKIENEDIKTVSKIIVDQLTPGLNSYLKAVEKLKGFFHGMAIKTDNLINKNDKFLEKKKKGFYNCVKKQAKEIYSSTFKLLTFYDVCEHRIIGCLKVISNDSLESYSVQLYDKVQKNIRIKAENTKTKTIKKLLKDDIEIMVGKNGIYDQIFNFFTKKANKGKNIKNGSNKQKKK